MKLGAYVVSGTLAGLATGALLGWLGGLVAEEVRVIAATLLGALAIGVGLAELGGRRVPLPQRNRETPQRWLHAGPLPWAMMNGAALGSAFATRIGFALWYVIPLGSLLLGEPAAGAAIYGSYALGRTASAYGILRWRARGLDAAEVTDALRALQPRARLVCAGTLVALGAVVVTAIGL